ncbi:prepilin-type N-terminal cleavage/methylation domain-containing protein [Pedosphaera parvula]|uniref:Prepilin-type N-terminal cleavage/methylation domain-containing protein n=1 Tax=Pedosphaera parvula (strain Ellin514) TaxID=320771 RepID=B9XLW7_PEDPL|nr:prepilin-type N-terminal cleavage/methylation domain-containing protein [Pedosphaera parvula]EEF59224.1 hypothetical protein Cflav_PD2429 [Pedosphaera parvula Ellin514]
MKFSSQDKQVAGSIGRGTKARLLRAFSLVEMLVVVVLLAVIILGLVAMFDQVRKAFTSSVTQVDRLEGGRMVMDLVTREVEEMAPYHASNVMNFYATYDGNTPILVQPLTDPKDKGTNVLESFYFLSSYNHQWTGVGFMVNSPEIVTGIPIGALYTTNFLFPTLVTVDPRNTVTNGLNLFTTNFPHPFYTNFHRLVDGVVHFRVLAYDARGRLLNTNYNNNTQINTNFYVYSDSPRSDRTTYNFWSNAVPAYLDVELGVLEDRTLQKLRGLTNNPTAANNFLNIHAAQVHLFRQRIAIRNADPQAYK